MKFATHQLTHDGVTWNCSVCGWTWREKPDVRCPGIPRWSWLTAPKYAMAKNKLKKVRKEPNGKPVGCIYASHKKVYIWLYDERTAVPMKEPNEA